MSQRSWERLCGSRRWLSPDIFVWPVHCCRDLGMNATRHHRLTFVCVYMITRPAYGAKKKKKSVCLDTAGEPASRPIQAQGCRFCFAARPVKSCFGKRQVDKIRDRASDPGGTSLPLCRAKGNQNPFFLFPIFFYLLLIPAKPTKRLLLERPGKRTAVCRECGLVAKKRTSCVVGVSCLSFTLLKENRPSADRLVSYLKMLNDMDFLLVQQYQ